ncbi:MAG: hypothetical protein IMW89_08530 [Ktedonobacteraceae bacterium]|nr:hypothetical protein [Ktedonobacteraceae bacterium]
MAITQEPAIERRAESVQEHPLRSSIRLLFIAALIIFIVTVLIGLLNGQKLVQLSHEVLLTHVHAGTIGWITLSVFALSLWLFGPGRSPETNATDGPFTRWLGIIGAVAVPCYVLAFLSGNFIARAAFAVPVLLVVLGFFGWIIARSSKVALGVERIALLAALFTLLFGATVGSLLQFQFATNRAFLPEGAFGAHPASLVAGYLYLIGIALSEWRLRPASARASVWGIVLGALFFLAGLVIATGLLLNLPPLLALNALLILIGAIVYVVRFAPSAVRLNWLDRDGKRQFAMSGAFIVFEVILNIYLVVLFITSPAGSEPPQGLFIALDHGMFIGVMTNALFALLHEATFERRSFWPWADDVLFWGMNIGLIGFLVALLSGIVVLERIFTPIMGLSILLGIVVYVARFWPQRAGTVVSDVQAQGGE